MLLNLYGSTEVAADVTCAEYPSKASADIARNNASSSIVPIGTAITCGFLVLDPDTLEEIVENKRPSTKSSINHYAENDADVSAITVEWAKFLSLRKFSARVRKSSRARRGSFFDTLSHR